MSDYVVKSEAVAAVIDVNRSRGHEDAIATLQSNVTSLDDNKISEPIIRN